MTRCKFKCDSISDHGPHASKPGQRISGAKFTPVYSSDPQSENRAFWDATPTGSLELGWTNGAVKFEPGKEYYIDISEAPGK